ncbi:P22AR C-terminal domain-containing protein [Gallibacterium anatis]|uniref:P22AR C-terminal domain-containing protein n=1 Tax=Gallibacterium anatis TaxID=750 RepID=UPI0038D3721E
MTTLTFQNTTLSVINQHNQIWFTGLEIGKALGYKDPSSNIAKLFDRNRDEFTPNMTALIDMKTVSGVQKVRIFSLRGCHLIGMLSHTKVAKEFRKWVLDILDQEVEQQKPKQLALPEPEKKYTLNWTESELKRLASFWCATYEMHRMLKHIEPGLRAIGSNFASTVYTQVSEYQSTLDLIHARLQVDIDPLQYIEPENRHWQYCLNTINRYKPKSQLRKNNF